VKNALHSRNVRNLIKYVILLAMPAILIVLTYSPNTYFRYFDFPFFVTFASYVVVYLLVLGISVVMAPALARRLSDRAIPRAVIQAVSAIFSFAVLALTCAMTGFNPPHTRVHGIFFSEWKFLNFFFYLGLPVALVSGATAFLEVEDDSPTRLELR
jgi:predicted MFS family arabinose efflux permease